MKNKLIPLMGFMIVIALVGGIITSLLDQKEGKEAKQNKVQIITSFYPSYIIGLNLADQIPEINVESLTDYSAGCLHDYQLTTEDMKTLSSADVFLMNGGGMESYIEDVVKNYPTLTMVDMSKDITMLSEESEEGGQNPHVWLDPERYKAQILNAKEGLTDYIESSSIEKKDKIIKKINSNTEAYLQKVSSLEEDYRTFLDGIKDEIPSGQNNNVVIFHDSFAYLADRAGLNVAYTVEIEGDTALSAGVIADVIDIIKKEKVRFLFTEKQYGDSITDRIEEETDAKVYIIDSAVTGDGTKDSYLSSMQNNLVILEEAFQELSVKNNP